MQHEEIMVQESQWRIAVCVVCPSPLHGHYVSRTCCEMNTAVICCTESIMNVCC